MTPISSILTERRERDRADRVAQTRQFTDDIQARMKALGWQQRDLGREMGVSQGCVSQWMKGPDLRLSTMVRMARACGGRLVVSVERPPQ